MTQLTGPWRKFFRAITALLTISFLSASPSCSVESEPEVLAHASYFRAGEGRQECEQEKKPFPDGVAFSHDVWR